MTHFTTEPAQPPREPVTVIPAVLEYVYGGHKDGVDAIELRATDRVGVTTVLVLSAPAAQHIAAHLRDARRPRRATPTLQRRKQLTYSKTQVSQNGTPDHREGKQRKMTDTDTTEPNADFVDAFAPRTASDTPPEPSAEAWAALAEATEAAIQRDEQGSGDAADESDEPQKRRRRGQPEPRGTPGGAPSAVKPKPNAMLSQRDSKPCSARPSTAKPPLSASSRPRSGHPGQSSTTCSRARRTRQQAR